MNLSFFTSLNPEVQIAFIIAVFIIFVLFLGIIFFALKTKQIRSKYFSIINDDTKISKSPHSSCKHKTDIEILLLEQQEMLSRYFRILDKEIVSMCMKEVEEEVHKVYYTAIEIFREYNSDDENIIILSKNFKNYIDCVKHFVIDQFRLWVRENHFAEKTDAEFELYCSNKAKNLENYIINFSEENRPKIENERFNIRIKDIYPQIRFSAVNVLKKCRIISIQKKEEAENLYEGFNKKVHFIIGDNYEN